MVHLVNRPTGFTLLSLECSDLHLLVVKAFCLQLVVAVESIAKETVILVEVDDFLGEVEEGLSQAIGVPEVLDVLVVELHPLLEELVYCADIHTSPSKDILVKVTHQQ